MNIKNTFFYSIILYIFFISGMDLLLLQKRTFIPNQIYSVFEYLHFGFAIFGSFFIGFFVIRKMVDKYDVNQILRTSLLISSFVLWTQYKTMHHSLENLFSKTVIDNLIVGINLGVLSYSVSKFLSTREELQKIKSTNYYYLLFGLLGAFYAYFLNYNNVLSGFLTSSIFYFFSYIVISFISIDNIQNKKVEIKSFILSIAYILLSILFVYSKFLEDFEFLTEDQLPLYIFLLFCFVEAFRTKKIKQNK